MAGLLRTKLRYLSCSLFGLLLVALGLFLHWLPTSPRCIIRSDRLSRVQFLSPDGRSFAAVPLDDDGTRIDRWDTTSGQLIAQASYKTKLSTAAYSKNGTLAAGFFWRADKPQLGEASGQLAIVDVIAGRESVVGRFAHNPRHKPRFSPQAKFVAFEDSEVRAGGGDPSRQTRLSIIDATSAQVIATFRVPRTSEEYPVYGFTSDDRLLFVFSYVGKTVQFTVWDTRQRQVLRIIPDIRRDWLLAPDGRTALVDFVRSGPGRDHLPVLWDLLDDQVRKLLAARHPGYSVLTYRAAFSSDSRTLATILSTDRDRIELWDVATGERRVTLIESAPFHPAAKGLANDHPNPVEQVWLRDCQLVFSPDSRTIAAFPVRHERADMPGLVVDESFIVWDVATGRRLWERKAAPGKGVFPIFTPNPRVLVEEDQNTGRIQLIKAQDGSVQETISIAPGIDFKHEVGSPEAPVFTPDGRLIAIRRRVPDRPPGLEKWLGDWWPWRRFTNSAVAIIVELATGREVFRGERPNLTDVLVSEDGRTALTLELEADSQATIIRCWDIPSPSRLPWSIGVPVVIASVIVVVKRVLWAKSD